MQTCFRQLIHSCTILPSVPRYSSPPQRYPACTSVCLPAFLGHWAPPTSIHTTPCFVFIPALVGGREGGTDKGIISLTSEEKRWHQHPGQVIWHEDKHMQTRNTLRLIQSFARVFLPHPNGFQ